MEVLLLTSFVALLGLKICVPENPNEEFEAQMNERFWTNNPFLRIFYGLTNIVGVIFVLASVAYLTFVEHWWYFIVYIIALLIAKILALFCVCIISSIGKNNMGFSCIKKQRIVGCLIIIGAIIFFIINL